MKARCLSLIIFAISLSVIVALPVEQEAENEVSKAELQTTQKTEDSMVLDAEESESGVHVSNDGAQDNDEEAVAEDSNEENTADNDENDTIIVGTDDDAANNSEGDNNYSEEGTAAIEASEVSSDESREEIQEVDDDQ